MLAKQSRLTKQNIERYLLRGRRIKTSLFLVLYTKIPSNKRPQISVTVSKKIAPKAVLRNRLRRRCYSAISSIVGDLSPTSAVLVSYLKPDTKISLDEIREELKTAFFKVGLYK